MTNMEIAREINAVKNLPFVSYIDVHEKGELLVVGLIPTLTQYLGENRRAINFMRTDFTLKNVIQGYKLLIVDYLKEGAQLTESILTESNSLLRVLVPE